MNKKQMTLGELIETLMRYSDDMEVSGISDQCDSYRGYYQDLAFNGGDTTVGELITICKQSDGSTFEGYKGGDYLMDKNTPIWISPYGYASGKYLTGFKIKDGVLVAKTKKEKW